MGSRKSAVTMELNLQLKLAGEDKCQSFQEPSLKGEEALGPAEWLRHL